MVFFMIGLEFSEITLASSDLYYIALIINSLWIFIQFVYCCSPQYTDDIEIKEAMKPYNLPFAYDVISNTQGAIQPPIAQQIPLQVIQPQPVQPQVIYIQQTLPN
eukprot:371953_1